MENTKKTYQQVFTFLNGAKIYLAKNQDETKLKYAIERTIKSLEPVVQGYHQKKSDIELDHAFTDEKGRVPFVQKPDGSREYEYSKEGLKAMDKAIDELFKSEVEIKVHFATEKPEDFNDKIYGEAFEGFVINSVS